VQILRRLDAPAPDNTHEALAGAIHRTHDRLAELVDHDPELDGTSTTVTAALFDGTRLTVGHVGDSRGYLLRDGVLSQLTKDHTFVQSLIDEGRITEEESRTHPHRNLILRAVDGVHDTEPDLFDVDLAPGDRIMLCSDGCSGVLDADRLTDILSTGTIDYAVVELVRASLDAGSTDNITVVVADVVDGDASAGDAETSAAAATGPMLVGAAADQPRKTPGGARSFFRGHRSGDTGEMEPVDGGPDGSTDGRPLDPEALRYAPRAPRRFVWFRRVLVLVVLLGLLLGGAAMAYSWSQRQYFVAVADDRVAIYRGIQSELPGNVLDLNRVWRTSDITIQSLPQARAAQVRDGIAAESMDEAQDIVANITELARVCPTPEPEPTPSERPSDDRTGTNQDGTNQGNQGGGQGNQGGGQGGQGGTQGGGSRDGGAEASPEASPSPTIAPPDCIEASDETGSAQSPGAEATP
jgi:protein phosphatase